MPMNSDRKLAHSIMMKFGTGHGEPNASQLEAIKKRINSIIASGKRPTHSDWASAVAAYCPSAGTHKYAGVDNSDLDTLLQMATQRREQ